MYIMDLYIVSIVGNKKNKICKCMICKITLLSELRTVNSIFIAGGRYGRPHISNQAWLTEKGPIVRLSSVKSICPSRVWNNPSNKELCSFFAHRNQTLHCANWTVFAIGNKDTLSETVLIHKTTVLFYWHPTIHGLKSQTPQYAEIRAIVHTMKYGNDFSARGKIEFTYR